MKKLLFALVAILCLTACHKDILSSIDDLKMQYQNLDSRVTRLENLCKEMNTNITALQTIVDVLQSNDYITGITEIKKSGDIIGYNITFGKHSPITIYNGEDGKDGKDGADGSSFAPTIGIQKDTDGVYYWTLNGSWLLDDQGNKLRVTGEKGEKGDTGAAGQNGTNGTDGVNGTNGLDGITPQLKIEDGFWFVSYNGGTSWTMVGRATGEQGEKGDKGDKGETGATGMTGQDGNTVFTAVEYDNNFVYFTLVGGQTIKVSRFSANTEVDSLIVDGAIMYEFSVSPTQKVYFSQGNLQYNAALGSHLCADGTTKPGTWRFAEHQYDTCNFNCRYASATCSEWQDLFAYGTSGYSNYPPYLFSNEYHSEPGILAKYNAYYNGNISGTYYDWGFYNAISNGGNSPETWRCLTNEEVEYLTSGRKDAKLLCFKAKINNLVGTIYLPDNWSTLIFPDFTKINAFSLGQWQILESSGAVFLPAAGQYCGDYSRSYTYRNYVGVYWTGTRYNESIAYVYAEYYNTYESSTSNGSLSIGNSVRLVKDVE